MRDQASQSPTLRALIFTVIGALLLSLLLGSLYLSIERFRSYSANQLLSGTQAAATALGLSLSHSIDARDPVAVQLALDAIFNSGPYAQIRYQDVQGNPPIERLRDAEPLENIVPDWFGRILNLPSPEAAADVFHGWQRLGLVTVVADNGPAYRALWLTLRMQLWVYAVVALLALLFLGLLLVRLLRPLQEMEKHAIALGRQDFSQRLALPGTRELKRVAMAMNHQSEQLGQLFEGQLKLITELRRQSSLDEVTGLPNRQQFDLRLRALVEARDFEGQGTLLLLQPAHFAEFNAQQGRAQGDACLLAVAGHLDEFASAHHGAFVGRRGGADFAMFLPGVSSVDATHWLAHWLPELDACYQQAALSAGQSGEQLQPLRFHAGLVDVLPGQTASTWLAQADLALRQAQAEAAGGSKCFDAAQAGAMGEQRWREQLEDALAQRHIRLQFQPLFAQDGQTVHFYQVMSRLKIEQAWVPAAVFVPRAARFGLLPQLDAQALETTCQALRDNNQVQLCVSLAPVTLADKSFMALLARQLADLGETSRRLWISIPEKAMVQHAAEVHALIKLIRPHGVRLLLDHFGVSGLAFGYLWNLPVQGIRLDPSYVRDIHERPDQRFFLQSLQAITQRVRIAVYVSGVENAAEWQASIDMGAAGGLGYHLGRPADAPQLIDGQQKTK